MKFGPRCSSYHVRVKYSNSRYVSNSNVFHYGGKIICILIFETLGRSGCRYVDLSVPRFVGLPICRSFGLFVCRFVGLSVCLSVCRSVGLSVGRSVGRSVGLSD